VFVMVSSLPARSSFVSVFNPSSPSASGIVVASHCAVVPRRILIFIGIVVQCDDILIIIQ
jgi:hypothetical protein